MERNAPTIPREIETPHSPGFPNPLILKAFENQFSSLANLAAIEALRPVIDIKSKNNSRGDSS
jgi:hypothetical protein